jgi:hypothetical protein
VGGPNIERCVHRERHRDQASSRHDESMPFWLRIPMKWGTDSVKWGSIEAKRRWLRL